MTAPYANTVWARAIAAELAAAGIDTAVIAPGSRSTPLTAAIADHDAITARSLLDERSAAYFALGRARMTGRPTPIVTTSGTATANLHPAVLEADAGRVPLLLLTADRPPGLQDSGANQTIDQTKLFGDAVRWYRDPGLPEADDRALRSLRTTIARAVATTQTSPMGPVHLNLPFRKPLEPVEVPDAFTADAPAAATGRDGAYVNFHDGTTTPSPEVTATVAAAIDDADRPLVVCGPQNPATAATAPITTLAARIDAPILADPLSQLRFGTAATDATVIGHYDAYLDDVSDWPTPDIVLRFGASPTSKPLRQYLAASTARQLLVDPAGDWREAEFRATDLLVGDPGPTATALADHVDPVSGGAWHRRWEDADAAARSVLADAPFFEGAVLRTVVEAAPAEATLAVSNSTPIRDLDRFASPTTTPITTVGNRGASGIDGVTSTALGAGAATDDPLVAVLGDLAYYHDMNGLLAIDRCAVDATIVLINNDGGGIFHMLPIADFDPPFTEYFRTPHGLDFEPSTALYDLEYGHITSLETFRARYTDSLATAGTQVIEVETDAATSHQTRARVTDQITDAVD
ncbi:MAG: 2-succinyl-5-enolpyruvyl-6-hydroxy-3-cyclohexene-1-carboxylic-acid synthase [Halobacteriaceae archaeon]